jgi:hypothetical protein
MTVGSGTDAALCRIVQMFKDKTFAWYEGRYVPWENDRHSPIVLVGGSYHRHWTARFAHVVVEFWLEHWKYVITTSIAIIGLWIAYRKFG